MSDKFKVAFEVPRTPIGDCVLLGTYLKPVKGRIDQEVVIELIKKGEIVDYYIVPDHQIGYIISYAGIVIDGCIDGKRLMRAIKDLFMKD